MQESAVCTTSLRSHPLRYKSNHRISYSLHKLLNSKNVTIQDIMKWHWQIAEYMYYMHTKKLGDLTIINLDNIRVDLDGNIVQSTLLRHAGNKARAGYLSTANSILQCHSRMISDIDITNKNPEMQKKLKIFNTISQHILMNNQLNLVSDAVSNAFMIVDELCKIIEEDIVNDLYKIFI